MTVPPQPSTTTFDYKNHREKSVAKYIEVRALYEEFALVVRNILKDVVTRQDIGINSIDWRAKSRESFAEKAVRRSEEDPNTPKYKNPLVEITDLAGIRVITFFPRTVKELDALIAEQFQIVERVDHTAFLEQEERFGYKSMHYLVKLSAERLRLPEYAKFFGLIAEIQVRTVLHMSGQKSSTTFNINPQSRSRLQYVVGSCPLPVCWR